MGRISKSLNMPECWRALNSQGLYLVYAPEGSAVREYANRLKRKINTSKAPVTAVRKHPDIVSPPVSPGGCDTRFPISDNAAATYSARGGPSASARADIQQTGAETGAAPQPDVSRASSAPRPDLPLLPAWLSGLPYPWPLYADKVKPGRALLWTYPEAGLDLAGQGSKERSTLIRKIIGALGLPAGSSNFWPHRSQPEAAAPGENEYFSRGVAWLSPSFVLVFGANTLAAINSELKFAKYTFISVQGRLHLILPDLADLENEREFSACIEFLSRFTRSLLRRG
ncbi:MAG: hypothetical protein IJD04_00465 [Desulfovibrionaceae bacterium]|nr:hypothetical protein [Desulfovibrionaceae bacterium]